MKKLISLYCLFLFSASVFSYLFIDRNFLYLKQFYTGFSFYHRPEVTALYILFITLFFVFYFYFLSGKNMTESVQKKLIKISILILLFSLPAMLSNDIFNYIFTGKVLFFYKENPYVVMPIEFSGDPFLHFTQAANKIALYGPSWILLSGIPFVLGFGNYLLTLFNFKLLNAILFVGTLFYFSKLRTSKNSLILFALNPLVLVETLTNVHNDIFMIFLIVYSLYLVKTKKTFWAIFLYILSVGVKYVSFVLLPVYIYLFIRGKDIDWDKVYFWSFILMFTAFTLSFIREEIYPWYALWFLPFGFLTNKKWVNVISISFTMSLMLRYVPFMLSGTYSGHTQIFKTLITFFPPICALAFVFIKQWRKKFPFS